MNYVRAKGGDGEVVRARDRPRRLPLAFAVSGATFVAINGDEKAAGPEGFPRATSRMESVAMQVILGDTLDTTITFGFRLLPGRLQPFKPGSASSSPTPKASQTRLQFRLAVAPPCRSPWLPHVVSMGASVLPANIASTIDRKDLYSRVYKAGSRLPAASPCLCFGRPLLRPLPVCQAFLPPPSYMPIPFFDHPDLREVPSRLHLRLGRDPSRLRLRLGRTRLCFSLASDSPRALGFGSLASTISRVGLGLWPRPPHVCVGLPFTRRK